MRTKTFLILALSLSLTRLCSAQTTNPTTTSGTTTITHGSNAPYIQGPVWTLTMIRTKAGLDDDYLKQISGTVKPVYEEEKKQRIILDYKILQGDAMAPQDYNIIIMGPTPRHCGETPRHPRNPWHQNYARNHPEIGWRAARPHCERKFQGAAVPHSRGNLEIDPSVFFAFNRDAEVAPTLEEAYGFGGSVFLKGANRSIGTGRKVVVLCSLEISRIVCRKRSCNAIGSLLIIAAACTIFSAA